jgi:hypothetical protein
MRRFLDKRPIRDRYFIYILQWKSKPLASPLPIKPFLGGTMKKRFGLTCGAALLLACATAWPQAQPPQNQTGGETNLAPGFGMRPSGGIDVSDIYTEVVQYDTDWKETEQHDVFKPTQTPATQPSSHILTGDFPVADGSFKLTEQLDPGDTGVHYTATMATDKPMTSNEMSLAFNLPTKDFAGKSITVDGQAVNMPADPAPKDNPHIFDKEGVKEIDLPTPSGTLTITGTDLSILVQDDRQWGDQRYGLRIHFTPLDEAQKQNKIDLQLQWKPAGG